ncbi:MAG: YqiA/YcfP family alpha/beta fold hydrolase [Lysobacterales bacterium]|jgi:predicted esterase YcpF (UPF0227 family)
MASTGAAELFYFHGFNSAIPKDLASSPKLAAVADFCRATDCRFLPQNIDYRRANERARTLLRQVDPAAERVIFCGGSMGGWFARIMQLLLAAERPGLCIEAVAFNPVFNLSEFSHYLEGPQTNYVTGEKYEFCPGHAERLVMLEQTVDYTSGLPYWVFVDRADETISARLSERFHAGFARFTAFDGGCHSFDHAREALEIFQPGCWNTAEQC